MADHSQQLEPEDDCLTPRQSTTISLRYPSIPVHGTPDGWLSNSLLVPMASQQDEGSVRSSDDTLSSFDDSVYDFVDDISYGTTDDEDQSRMTESVSYVDESSLVTPNNQDLERTLSRDSPQHPPSDAVTESDVPSSMSSSPVRKDIVHFRSSSQEFQPEDANQRRPSSLPNIRFEEFHHREGIYHLDTPSMPQNLAVTVRQHMLGSGVSLNGPYRLVYVGDTAKRDQVRAKISTAMASSWNTQAQHGNAHLPRSDGHEILVYHCVDASFSRECSGHDTIALTLEDQTQIKSSWDGSKFSIATDWNFPAVAIFFLTEHDSVSARQVRRFARSFMARHRIPSMVINERSSWDRPSEAMMIDHLTPHICLQINRDPESSSKIVRRLPIDLSTFSRIDDLQLNQNLAYLARHYGTSQTQNPDVKRSELEAEHTNRQDDVPKPNISMFATKNIREYLQATSYGLPHLLLFLAAASIYMAASVIITQHFNFSGPSAYDVSNIPSISSSATPIASSAVVTSIPVLKSKPTAAQPFAVQDLAEVITPQRVLARKSQTDLAALLLESTPTTIVNKSEHFKIQILGDAHLILRPPHWFTRLRRTPRLNFKVTQGSRVLKHQASTLFDGVYALELAHDEAHGPVNITVWTESKPKIHESLQADFGSSWLYSAGWKKAASALSTSFRQDLDVVQTSLMAGYIQASAEFRSLMRKTSTKAVELGAGTRTIRKASISRLTRVTDLMLAYERSFTSGLSNIVKHKKAAAAKDASLLTEHLRRDVSAYVSDRVQFVRVHLQAAPTAYRMHLRNTQKKALRLWWSMTGMPDQRAVGVTANCRYRACGGKSKKRL
ncbi:MAG: hypothetical protein Q9201_000124 [Fulgogasparrea decipioides]